MEKKKKGLFKRVAVKSKDSAKKVVFYDAIARNAADISDGLKILAERDDGQVVKETFEEARARLGVTDEDIKASYKSIVYSFYIMFIAFLACLFLFVYYAFFIKTFLGALTALSVMSLFFAMMFSFSFRAYQIKARKLCSVDEWMKRKSDWFPKIGGV